MLALRRLGGCVYRVTAAQCATARSELVAARTWAGPMGLMAKRGLATEPKKKKRRHPGGRGAPEFEPTQLPPMDYEKVELRMDKLVEKHQKDLLRFRGGSASVGLLNNVTVKLYGANCELHTVARVFKQNDNILNVQPYDPKSGSKIVEGITSANLGLNPSAPENNVIKIVVPKPTKELRVQLVKGIKIATEESKKQIRTLRSKGISEIKLSMEGKNEDLKALGEKDIHSMYTKAADKVQDLTDKKIKEVMA